MSNIHQLSRNDFSQLLQVLQSEGYRCVGPQVRDGAILYENLDSIDQLPRGWQDRQAPGEYRLSAHNSPRYFAWANGPQALKPRLFSSREVMWKADINSDNGISFRETHIPNQPLAVIGVRACDLAALRLQDAHFIDRPQPDPYYANRREQLFLVAVNCTHPAATCFCVSTGDGPRVTTGYDLVLSELDDCFLITADSEKGESVLAKLTTTPATADAINMADQEIESAARSQTRTLPSRNLREVLFDNLDHPRWNDVAERCLSCGNCTSVCPTCFCYSENEQPALQGHTSEHVREWDSCFTQGHSYIHGFVVRAETRPRYRQWLTHKLGSWHDQYGRSGCVGCGRCITWCPVGIDITVETAEICMESAND
jgi:ferredoxin